MHDPARFFNILRSAYFLHGVYAPLTNAVALIFFGGIPITLSGRCLQLDS